MRDELHAPWALAGECIAGLVRGAGPVGELPAGVKAMPGPVLVLAERYTASPVGQFNALSVARPARIGLRPGWCFTTMVVSVHDRLMAGRLNWGFPGELGTLSWGRWADEVSLVWEERSIEVRGWASGWRVPFLVPLRALQHRGDGSVVVPSRLWGRARLARVEVAMPDDDPLAALAGSHRGVVVSGLHVTLRPARHPRGALSSLPAPSRAAEPGWSCERADPGVAAGARVCERTSPLTSVG